MKLFFRQDKPDNQDEIFSQYMERHLDLAFDVVDNLNSKWDEVERNLASEW